MKGRVSAVWMIRFHLDEIHSEKIEPCSLVELTFDLRLPTLTERVAPDLSLRLESAVFGLLSVPL